jgi:hypothetical protein
MRRPDALSCAGSNSSSLLLLLVLLLQVMDYGYPQFTEAPILQEFIKTDSYRMEVRKQQAGSAVAGSSSHWLVAAGDSLASQCAVAFVSQAKA